jgi:hypothetical protein
MRINNRTLLALCLRGLLTSYFDLYSHQDLVDGQYFVESDKTPIFKTSQTQVEILS